MVDGFVLEEEVSIIKVSYKLFAKSIGYSCINVESTRPSISIRNDIFTKSSVRKLENFDGSSSRKLSSVACGGDISTFWPVMVERDVAAAPIIWFIASEIADNWSSPIVPSVFVPSPPIIKSVITMTSCSFRIRTLVPSTPMVYLIVMKTQGLS